MYKNFHDENQEKEGMRVPTNVVNIENAKGHFTKAQKASRAAAQGEMTRKNTRLVAPKPIKEDPVAYGYWTLTLKRMRGITLLDDLDSEMLSTYCQILSRRDTLSAMWRNGMEASTRETDPAERMARMGQVEDVLKRLEAQERLALAYGEKLGMTPSGRVRLAKTRAEEKTVDPNEELYGDDG